MYDPIRWLVRGARALLAPGTGKRRRSAAGCRRSDAPARPAPPAGPTSPAAYRYGWAAVTPTRPRAGSDVWAYRPAVRGSGRRGLVVVTRFHVGLHAYLAAHQVAQLTCAAYAPCTPSAPCGPRDLAVAA